MDSIADIGGVPDGSHPCIICGNSTANNIFPVREMMFGFRDEFRYLECSDCGCISRLDAPESMKRYYPPEYGAHVAQIPKPQSLLERISRRALARHALTGKGLIGKHLMRKRGRPKSPGFGNPDYLMLLAQCGAKLNSVILEVGCGAGALLQMMHHDGFSNLYGVDPNIDSDRVLQGGVEVRKTDISTIDFPCDVIMFHHSFEHVDNPKETLADVARLLRPGGYSLVRMPVAGTFAWREYGVNWAQLDAPRHACIQSVASMELLATENGLTLEKVWFDSTEFQFLASEQYARDIPFRSESSYLHSLAQSPFSREDVATYRRRAVELNRQQDGDMACFFLRK